MAEVERLVPILRVDDVDAAHDFYCGVLGFEQVSLYVYAPEGKRNPAYLSVTRGGVVLHLDSGNYARNGNAYLYVDDVDAFLEEIRARGFDQDVKIWNQTWGMREFALPDPFGNALTVGRALAASEED